MAASIPLIGLSIEVQNTIYSNQTIRAILTRIPTNASASTITWDTDDHEKATVDSYGNITALSLASTTFTLSVEDSSYSASVLMTILPSVTSIAFVSPPSEIYVAYTVPLTLAITWSDSSIGPTNGSVVPVISYSSSNKNVIRVDSSGNMFAVATTTSAKTITASIVTASLVATTASVIVKSRPNLTVTLITSASIYLSSVYVGRNTQAYPIIEPSTIAVNIVWSTSNPSIVYINPSTGIVTGISNGSFTITASITDTTGSPSTTTVTSSTFVCTTIINSLILSPTSVMGIQIGQPYTATLSDVLSIYPSSASANQPTWVSSMPGIATVNANYSTDTLTITGITNGTCVITVASTDANKASATMIVSVETGLTSVTTNIPSTINVGKIFQASIIPTGYYSGAQWSSSDTSVANVSATGLITGISAGNVTITLIAGGQAGFTTYTKNVNITQLVTSILLSPVSIFLAVGSTQAITPTIFPSSVSTTALQWNSSSPAVATVDNSGNILGIKPGVSIITAQALDGSNVYAFTSVNCGIAITSISVSLPSTTLYIGKTSQAVVTINPANAIADFISWNPNVTEVTAPITDGIIQVTNTGLIIPMTPGTNATFQVYAGNQYGTNVSVTSAPITVISLIKGLTIPGAIYSSIKKVFSITPYIFPSNASNQILSWQSLAQGVATVDSSGIVTVVGGGIARITATTTDGSLLTGTSVVYVYANPFYLVSTVAGTGQQGSLDGSANDAEFRGPTGIAISSSGNIYIGDTGNNKVRKLDTSGNVTTIASITNPNGIVLDSSENIYVSSQVTGIIYKITDEINITSFAVGLSAPSGMTIDPSGNIYLAEYGNNRILKINPSGLIRIVAGSTAGYRDGTINSALFSGPFDVDIDSSGNLYVAEYGSSLIRIIYASGIVTTLAGQLQQSGYVDGQGTTARFTSITNIAVDPFSGNIYTCDWANRTIRKITPAGLVSTFTGSYGVISHLDGQLKDALFEGANAIRIDQNGNMYLADSNYIRAILLFEEAPTSITNFQDIAITATDFTISWTGAVGAVSYSYILDTISISPFVDNGLNFKNATFTGLMPDSDYTISIKAINPNGFSVYPTPPDKITIRTLNDNSQSIIVSTFAGSNFGYTNGRGTTVKFGYVSSIATNISGIMYIVDRYAIRKVLQDATVSLLAGDVYNSGYVDAAGENALFNNISQITTDTSGNVYVADAANSAIRKIDISGNVTTLHQTALNEAPYGLACDSSNNIYFTKTSSNIIYKIDSSSNITTFVDISGNTTLNLMFDTSGTMYAVMNSFFINKITPDGTVSFFAGNPSGPGYSDGQGSTAAFNGINGITSDISGNIYIADTNNNAIRKIIPDGTVSTLIQSLPGLSDGLINQVLINNPYSITIDPLNTAVDGSNYLYIADTLNFRIRKINLL